MRKQVCRETRVGLEAALCAIDPRNAPSPLNDPGAIGPGGGPAWIPAGAIPEDLARHLEACSDCQLEARFLQEVDEALRGAFSDLDRRTPPPGEDRIARLLRRLADEPDFAVERRARRSVRAILWLALYAFALAAGCGLLALGYRALFRR